MHYFGLQTRSLWEGEEEEGEEEEERGNQAKVWNFCMDSCIHDFGMIFVQEFLGHDC